MKVLEAQECCIRAYYGREKLAELMEANMCLELTRHLVRLAYELKFFNGQKYGVVSEKINEVGRMIGGWLKHLGRARPPGAPSGNAAQSSGAPGGRALPETATEAHGNV